MLQWPLSVSNHTRSARSGITQYDRGLRTRLQHHSGNLFFDAPLVRTRPLAGALGGARHATSITFLSQAGVVGDVPRNLGLKKRTLAVHNVRSITKKDMIHNAYTPRIEVDAQTYEVRADGELLTCEPAAELPLAQRYFLF